MGNNFLLPVIANHPWVAATPCTCGRRITNQAHLGVHAEQTEVNDTLHDEVVSCSLGGSSTCKNKMVPNSPFSCSALCCGFFFLKNCVVELVSRTFLQSASHDNYVLVMTRLTFFILDLYET
jgi:hypothetical protein